MVAARLNKEDEIDAKFGEKVYFAPKFKNSPLTR